MPKALIGKKIGMTRFIGPDGVATPVTVCELGPCVVVQKKNFEKDGYQALKLGYLDAKEKHLTKAILTDLKNKKVPVKRVFREVEMFDEKLEVGQEVDCSIFAENDLVQVSAISKGKGFAGVMKRYGFGGGRKTHGSHFHRAPGSIGACAYPGEVWKGQRMPGRYGTDKVTIKNLKIVKILQDKNLVLISGSIPGRKNSLVSVQAKG